MAPIGRLREALCSRYAIEDVVGQGGSATVLQARDLKYGRTVALKVLHSELTNPRGAERFLAEVRITARLQHPHILPLLDSGRASGHLYLVTPFVRGNTLGDRLRSEGRLPVDEALRITIALADALAYAHRQGVVHLDVKPANILLSNGHPVIADFGIARAASDARAGEYGSWVPAGTPDYMSPEQIAGGIPLDGRSDVYSLCCLLYEMLVGRRPFTGSTAATVMTRHLYSEPPPVSEATRGRVAALDDVVGRGLAKDPADRHPSADGLAEALKVERAALEVRPARFREATAVFGAILLAGLTWSAVGSAAPRPLDADPAEVLLNAEVPPDVPASPYAAPPVDCALPSVPLTL